MSVEFVTQRGAASGLSEADGINAKAPAGVAEGDLMILSLSSVQTSDITSHPGWTLLKACRSHTAEPGLGPLTVWQRYADADDAATQPDHLWTFGGGHNVTYTITAWRNVPEYTDANDDADLSAATVHDVPAVITPTADTEIIVCSSMDVVGGTVTTNEALAIAGFTQRAYKVGDILGSFNPSNPVSAQFSRRAGSAGLQGPWELDTTTSRWMSFVVLGLVPRSLARGVQTLPYFVPLGNNPAT